MVLIADNYDQDQPDMLKILHINENTTFSFASYNAPKEVNDVDFYAKNSMNEKFIKSTKITVTRPEITATTK